MKPLRLSVEGFMAFRVKQEISFHGLGLFAISGPTGAGKSSILDAMMYALYGEIPRLGGQGYQEIISHGATRLAVTLDFEVRGRVYRAVRALRRGGQTTAQLVELNPETRAESDPLADKVRDVDSRVVEMLGLDYRMFAQAVVLPQGEFQRFLKAQPKDRRDMLSRLLRLGRYELMRKAAQKRLERATSAAQAAERRLAEDFAGVDEGAIASMTEHLAAQTQRVADLGEEVGKADVALQETRAVAKATGDLARKRADEEVLAAQRSVIDGERARLAGARRAVGLRDVLENLRRAQEAATAARERQRKAGAALDAAREKREAVAAALAIATEAAKQRPVLDDKIRDLQRVIGVQSALAETKKRLAGAEKDASHAEAALASTRKKLVEAGATSAAAKKKLDEAKGARDRIGYPAERAERLRELADSARAVVAETRRRDDAKADIAEEIKKRTLREKARDVAKRAATAAGELHKKAKEQLREAAEARRAEERRHHAVLLRKDLAPGDSCPVCEQPVKNHLRIPRGAEKALRNAEEAEGDARERAETAGDTADAAKQKLAKTETSLQETADSVAKLEKQLAAAEKKLSARAAALAKDARAAMIEPALPTDAEAILEEEIDLARRQSKWQKAQDAHRDAERAADKARAANDQLSADELSQATALEEARKRRDDAREVHDAQAADVRAVAGNDDPGALRNKLQTRSDELREKLAAAGEAHSDANTAVRLAAAENQQATLAVATSKAQEAEMAATVATRTAEVGFATEKEARSAALDDAAMAQVERTIREYDGACDVVAREIATLLDQLGNRRATPDAVRQRESAKEVATREHGTALAERGALATRLARAKADLVKATTLRKDLEAAQAEIDVYGTLAGELKNDKFLDYLLIESLHKLGTGASVRLKELSDRYTVETRDSDFYVVDHDNAGEKRSVDTLSGGETFLASLALALELSAQIQSTAGAVQLDSIFIDEGFGSLDPEALETVAAAIESLPHAGRMVGIITHVAELTERMPARISVVKGADGSRIRIGDPEIVE